MIQQNYFCLEALFTDYLHQHSLPSHAVKLTIKHLLPRTKIHLTVGDGNDHFTAHQGSFDMGICIVLEAIVFILSIRFFRCQFFQPHLEILMKARFIIVDKDTGRDMHGIA